MPQRTVSTKAPGYRVYKVKSHNGILSGVGWENKWLVTFVCLCSQQILWLIIRAMVTVTEMSQCVASRCDCSGRWRLKSTWGRQNEIQGRWGPGGVNSVTPILRCYKQNRPTHCKTVSGSCRLRLHRCVPHIVALHRVPRGALCLIQSTAITSSRFLTIMLFAYTDCFQAIDPAKGSG